MAQKSGKGKKPAIAKKVVVKAKIVKAKEARKVKEIKKKVVALKKTETLIPLKKVKPVTSPHEFRMNIRCRRCFFIDGYTFGEKTCHICKEEIYEIDKI